MATRASGAALCAPSAARLGVQRPRVAAVAGAQGIRPLCRTQQSSLQIGSPKGWKAVASPSSSPRVRTARRGALRVEAKKKEEFRPPRFGEQPWQYGLSMLENALEVGPPVAKSSRLINASRATSRRLSRRLCTCRSCVPRGVALKGGVKSVCVCGRSAHTTVPPTPVLRLQQRFPQAQSLVRFVREQPLLSVGIGVALASAISFTIASLVLPTIFFAVRKPSAPSPLAYWLPPIFWPRSCAARCRGATRAGALAAAQ